MTTEEWQRYVSNLYEPLSDPEMREECLVDGHRRVIHDLTQAEAAIAARDAVIRELLDRHCEGNCHGYDHYEKALALIGGEKGEGTI